MAGRLLEEGDLVFLKDKSLVQKERKKAVVTL